MKLNEFLLFALLFARSVNSLLFKYDVESVEPEIYIPCPEYPDKFIDKFMVTPLNVTALPDDTLHVVGDIRSPPEFDPSKKYEFNIEFFKRQRGNWQTTIYTIKRADFCQSLFDPIEYWAPFTKNIPPEDRKCPLKKGQKLSVDFTTEQGFELPHNSMAGEYWVRITLGNVKEDDFYCTDYFFILHRV